MSEFFNYLDISEGIRKSGRKWVITGAAGFIGSHVVRRLLELNQEVIGIDKASGYLKNLEFLKTEKGFAKRFKYVGADICYKSVVEKHFVDNSIVVHLAAEVGTPKSLKKPAEVYQNNVLGFLNVLETCRQKDLKLIYASSFSGQFCLSPYAASKSSCDRLAISYDKSFGFISVPLRFFNIFGPGQLLTGDYAPAIGKWIHQIEIGEQPTVYGKCWRDFTYIENAVQAIILAAVADIKVFTVFDIAHGVSVQTDRVVEHIIRTMNSKIKFKREKHRKCDPAISEGNIKAAGNAFGYRPTVSVYEGVDKYIEWYRQNGVKDKVDLYKS